MLRMWRVLNIEAESSRQWGVDSYMIRDIDNVNENLHELYIYIQSFTYGRTFAHKIKCEHSHFILFYIRDVYM